MLSREKQFTEKQVFILKDLVHAFLKGLREKKCRVRESVKNEKAPKGWELGGTGGFEL